MPTNDDDEIELDGIKYVRKDTDARMQSIKQDSSEAIKLIIAYMRVARSEMCLKDRAILLNKINLLEKELKKLEE